MYLQQLADNVSASLKEMEAIVPSNLFERLVYQESFDFFSEFIRKFNVCENKDQLIEIFLSDRWNFVKGSYFSYTSIPNARITRICCDMANYLASIHKKPALSFLMPGLKWTWDQVLNSEIDSIPLDEIIHLYILSDDCESLIPIYLLDFLTLDNQLDDLTNPCTLKSLSANEKKRLIGHSLSTKELVERQKKYLEATRENISFYSELHDLIKGLQAGGEHGLQGGAAQVAGKHAYRALENFQDYWKQLTLVQQTEICKSVEVKTLITKITDPLWQDDCVEEAAKEIRRIADINREKFTQITLTQEHGSKVVSYYASQFEAAKRALCSYIEKKLYSNDAGDRLNLSLLTIERYKEYLRIDSIPDIIFMLGSLQPKEITTVGELFYKPITDNIKTAEDLLSVLLALNSEQTTAFTCLLNTHISESKIFVIGESVGIFLDFLSMDILEAFVAGATKLFQPNEQRWWKYSFYVACSHLDESKKMILVDAMIPSMISDMITSAVSLEWVMLGLPEAVVNNVMPKLLLPMSEFSKKMLTASSSFVREVLAFLPEIKQSLQKELTIRRENKGRIQEIPKEKPSVLQKQLAPFAPSSVEVPRNLAANEAKMALQAKPDIKKEKQKIPKKTAVALQQPFITEDKPIQPAPSLQKFSMFSENKLKNTAARIKSQKITCRKRQEAKASVLGLKIAGIVLFVCAVAAFYAHLAALAVLCLGMSALAIGKAKLDESASFRNKLAPACN